MLLGLEGPARAIFYSFATSQGLLDALTDHPLGPLKTLNYYVPPPGLHATGR